MQLGHVNECLSEVTRKVTKACSQQSCDIVSLSDVTIERAIGSLPSTTALLQTANNKSEYISCLPKTGVKLAL